MLPEAKYIQGSHITTGTQLGDEPKPPISGDRQILPGDWALLGGLAFLLFFIHMLVSGRYGYFVDELYYLACSHHLDWGYVDQAPLITVATWLERVTLGDSLRALRFLPALAAGGAHVDGMRSHRT